MKKKIEKYKKPKKAVLRKTLLKGKMLKKCVGILGQMMQSLLLGFAHNPAHAEKVSRETFVKLREKRVSRPFMLQF